MFPSPAPQSSTLLLINFLHHTKSINQQLLLILKQTWGFCLIFFSPAVRDASSWYSLGKTVSTESKKTFSLQGSELLFVLVAEMIFISELQSLQSPTTKYVQAESNDTIWHFKVKICAIYAHL